MRVTQRADCKILLSPRCLDSQTSALSSLLGLLKSPPLPGALQAMKGDKDPVECSHTVLSTQCTHKSGPGCRPWCPPPVPVSSRHARFFPASGLRHRASRERPGPVLQLDHSCGLCRAPGKRGTGHCGATSQQRAVQKRVCLCAAGEAAGSEPRTPGPLPDSLPDGHCVGNGGLIPAFLQEMPRDGIRGAWPPGLILSVSSVLGGRSHPANGSRVCPLCQPLAGHF